jgi:hypothetical protein
MTNVYYSHEAISFSWKHFTAMNRNNKALVFCDDVNKSTMYWELYKEFFTYKCNPTFVPKQEATIHHKQMLELHVPWILDVFDRNKHDDVFTSKLKNIEKNNTITFSYQDYKDNKKGISKEVKKILLDNIKGINLEGYSNDDYDTLYLKISALAKSKLFIGTDTSWGNMCCHFRVPALRLYQIVPLFTSISQHAVDHVPRL